MKTIGTPVRARMAQAAATARRRGDGSRPAASGGLSAGRRRRPLRRDVKKRIPRRSILEPGSGSRPQTGADANHCVAAAVADHQHAPTSSTPTVTPDFADAVDQPADRRPEPALDDRRETRASGGGLASADLDIAESVRPVCAWSPTYRGVPVCSAAPDRDGPYPDPGTKSNVVTWAPLRRTVYFCPCTRISKSFHARRPGRLRRQSLARLES